MPISPRVLRAEIISNFTLGGQLGSYQQNGRDRYIGIGEIETREMMRSPVKIEHIYDMTPEYPVDQIPDYAGVKENFAYGVDFTGSENAFALPKKKRERRDAENGERPNLPLKHPPGATAVLDVRKIEKAVDDGNGRRPFQEADGQFFDDRVDQHKVGYDHERDQKTFHLRPRSISLWHSMHVRTNGWFMSRGLRISCPQTVQTP